jgi:DUF4097 and DUF4098 domain-containing protein YvlB
MSSGATIVEIRSVTVASSKRCRVVVSAVAVRLRAVQGNSKVVRSTFSGKVAVREKFSQSNSQMSSGNGERA